MKDTARELELDDLLARYRALEKENEGLRRMAEMHNEMIRMVLEGSGVHSITDRLAALGYL